MAREPRDLMLKVLQEIRDEARQTNARIEANTARIDENGARIDRLAEQMVRGFTGMHERLDRLDRRFDHFLTGEHGEEHRWLQRRVERIESHLELEPLEH